MLHFRRLIYRAPNFYSSLLTNPPSYLTRHTNHVTILHFETTKPSLHFSSMSNTILVQARDIGKLSEELESAISDRMLDKAWNLHEQHIQMENYPRKSIINKLLTACAETSQLHWVEKAYKLVETALSDHRHKIFEKETLIYLSLSLAKCNLPIPASTLLRKLIEMELYPPVNAWSTIIAHMSQTHSGAYLSAELILEIGYLFQNNRVDPRKKINDPLISMKPNVTAFNIALAGCVLFGSTRKAEQLLDMLPKINIKPDSTLLIIMGYIYERNGRLEDLKKLKRHVDEALHLTDSQFLQYYNCLLSCHLKFGDLESASKMILDMLRKSKKAGNSLGVAVMKFDEITRPGTSVSGRENGSGTFGKFSKLEGEAKELLEILISKLYNQLQLVTTERGILYPTEMTYVKLVKAYLESGKIKELAEFLINVEREDSPVSVDNSNLIHVINACISLNLLDQAHDLLDEMRLSGVKTGSLVYASLLKAYCKERKVPEIGALLRDAEKSGIQLDGTCYNALIESRVMEKDTHGALNLFKEMKEGKISRFGHQKFDILLKGCEENEDPSLMVKLLHEIKEGERFDYGVHEWNQVIHFFCKKRLMNDAEKALKKMRSLGIYPNAQTFHSMVTGYGAIGGKYIEVTELWGEMKSFGFASGMKFDQELLDSVLYTFVRGGFFIRANEVVEMMEKGNMFVDKYKYRALFLKYHKTLYKGKASKIQSETQVKKREAGSNFKKWIGLN